MHHIQRKILEKLLYAKTLGYAAMRPQGVESNLYAYHLERLVKEGLILKENKQYTLSPYGLSVIDRLSHAGMKERLQPHIVTAIDLTNDQGQTAVFKRSFQPFIDLYGFPMGKTHMEETVVQAAERELTDKTGLLDIQLVQRGIVYVESWRNGARVGKILCHVFQAAIHGSPIMMPVQSRRGETVWLDHATLASAQVMPGFIKTKQLLDEHPGFFFAEISEEF